MANSAAQRLLATAATREHSLELPKFRYLDDASRFINTLVKAVSATDAKIEAQQKTLASLASKSVKAAVTKTTAKKLVPGMQKLQAHYDLTSELYERYRSLAAVESQVALQFIDRRGDGYAKVTSALANLKSKVQDQMRRVLSFASEVADKHVPKQFDECRQAIAQEVENSVRFEDSEQFLYASASPDDQMVFTSYLLLLGAHAADGRKVPTLFISLQWVVGEGYYVQLNQEFQLPEALMRAEPVEDLQGVCGQLTYLLGDEGFEAEVGKDLPAELK